MNELTVLEFFGTWCGPCMQIKKILPRLEEQITGKASLTLINVDEEKDKKTEFHITKIPTFVILNDDKELQRFEGVHPLAQIGDAVIKHYNVLNMTDDV